MGILESWTVDEEVLPHIIYISSDSEEDASTPPYNPQPVPQQRPLRIVYPVQEIISLNESKVGRKRAKRQENQVHLLTLGSDEYPDLPEDLIQSRGSHFAQIMKNDSAMQVWSMFMDASEETQDKILQDYEQRNSKPKTVKKNIVISPEDALMNMSFEMRKFVMKSNLPLGLLAYLENEVIEFFLETPNKVYTADKYSSYERRILHGIAVYYKLQSKSYDCKITNHRLLSLHNANNEFSMPSTRLYEYLAEKRRTKIQGFRLFDYFLFVNYSEIDKNKNI